MSMEAQTMSPGGYIREKMAAKGWRRRATWLTS